MGNATSIREGCLKGMGSYLITLGGKTFSPDGASSIPAGDVEAHNRQLDAQEVTAFGKAPVGARWFAYWHDCGDGRVEIRTFMGTVLARVVWQGRKYKVGAFGRPSERINFRARGEDDSCWSGTFYVSSGDYVRMRRVADQ